MRAVLGAGAHGKELAALLHADLFDDDPTLGHLAVSAYEFADYAIGAAWPATRRLIASRARCEAESGVVVFPGAHVSPSAVLGRHSHVSYNAVVSHGCTVGEFAMICANAVLGGEVTVCDDVFVGAGAVVIHGGITIGKGAVIGAGAVVLHDVEPGAIVVGVPARPIHHREVQLAKAWAR